ncbi:hypothetical protein [Gloeocapsopsis crepidinum]|nr:hypothetical protein [Gloeocapsopsis crepidinum]
MERSTSLVQQLQTNTTPTILDRDSDGQPIADNTKQLWYPV